ncbi:MAG: arylsulfatase [Planctomycetota bacterium]
MLKRIYFGRQSRLGLVVDTFVLTLAVTACGVQLCSGDETRPNVVIMLADDMGFGELSCLNPDGKIPTPQLDRIAASGMIFTDAHSGSSVCTPTRYGLLTGRYAWRTRLQSGVVTGGPSLFAEDRLTLAKLLSKQGYDTAVIGKWHLGMLFDGKHIAKEVAIGSRVTHGPIDRGGFDTFYGFHHARQIRLWIDQDRVTEHIEPVEMLPRLAATAVDYIKKRASDDDPFLLYVPWSSPHSPVVPTAKWKGKSGLNEHADFVMQTDDAFGQVVDALRATGKLANTLIVCSCDNGTSAPTSSMKQLRSMGHDPSGGLRGSKADIWDGGHRVPFLVSWPGIVQPGTSTSHLVCLSDIFATLSEIVGGDVPDDAGEDSVSFLSALRGKEAPQRSSIVHHSVSGYFAIRDATWKLCLCPGSGGWTNPKPTRKNWQKADSGGQPMVQLYRMADDRGEQENVAAKYPQQVQRLREELDQIVARGRSTPGAKQTNDVPVRVNKRPKAKSK